MRNDFAQASNTDYGPNDRALSGYDLRVMLYGAMGIFALKFWTVLWFIARWLEGHISDAMYPNQGITTLFHYVKGGGIYKEPILNIILFAMYIAFPIIWSGMMSWVGIRVGDVLARVMNDNANPAKAGDKTGMSVPGSSAVKKFF